MLLPPKVPTVPGRINSSGMLCHSRTLFVLLFLAAQYAAVAQWNTREVLVLDSADRLPVAEVSIAVGGHQQGVTDGDGKARLRWNGRPDALVHFTRMGYRSSELRITKGAGTPGPWVVYLVPADLQLAAVTVGRAKPEVVFQRADLHAADLLINAKGLWVLAYEHPVMLRAEGNASEEILRDVRLVLLDSALGEVALCPVPEDVLGLRHDLRNNVLIEGTKRAFGAGRAGDELVLYPFGLEELRYSVLPWTDSIPGWVVGSNADAGYPAIDHLAYDPQRDSTRKICSVVDSFMMDLFRSSYKYLKGPEKVTAMNLAADLGVDKETVAGYMSGFSSNIWYRPLYAPLFVVGDTLLVFDHAWGRMRKFTHGLAETGGVPLAYQVKELARQWSGKLIQDRVTQRIYAAFQRNGITWLRAIDPCTGALGSSFRLANRYPEHVQVHAGMAYYIWRPYGSLQKRTVYRERM